LTGSDGKLILKDFPQANFGANPFSRPAFTRIRPRRLDYTRSYLSAFTGTTLNVEGGAFCHTMNLDGYVDAPKVIKRTTIRATGSYTPTPNQYTRFQFDDLRGLENKVIAAIRVWDSKIAGRYPDNDPPQSPGYVSNTLQNTLAFLTLRGFDKKLIADRVPLQYMNAEENVSPLSPNYEPFRLNQIIDLKNSYVEALLDPGGIPFFAAGFTFEIYYREA
jgi:hypothetical protein